jgi:peptidoglycan/xylan/chitin deacetylase (PgdA/CDA1 family)
MRYLREHDYHVINLATLMGWFAGQTLLTERSIVISFDDGFLDTFEYACPVLREHGFTATFFMISGLLGKTNSWMTAQGHPRTRLMDWREIESLTSDGFEVGSHSETHRDLTVISPADAKKEIESSKRTLEDRLGVPVKFFAYPFGRYDDTARQLVRDAGYRAACATAPGFLTRDADNYRLCRLEIAGTDSVRAFSRKVMFGVNKFTNSDLIRYYAGRVAAKALGC